MPNSVSGGASHPGPDCREAGEEAAALTLWSAVCLWGDGPGGSCTAAAVAVVSAQSPSPRRRLSRRLPLLQHHGGVWGPAAARGPTRNPAWDAGGNCMGLQARNAHNRRGGCASRWADGDSVSRTLPQGSKHLPVLPPSGLQTLFLQDNSIAGLEPGILAPLAALRHLYLHNNSLRALEPGAFRAQSRLLELALTGNRLRGLRLGAFTGLAQLRVLYLAGNQLVQLLDFTFLHLPVRGRGGTGSSCAASCSVDWSGEGDKSASPAG